MRGYCGIGIYKPQKEQNIGTLFRSAYCFDINNIFVIGTKYKHQASDTTKAWRHMPLYEYENFDHFFGNIPKDCALIGIELGGRKLKTFSHPERAIYLLGSEGLGLPEEIIDRCGSIVTIGGARQCLNVSVAGSIVMWDRSRNV